MSGEGGAASAQFSLTRRRLVEARKVAFMFRPRDVFACLAVVFLLAPTSTAWAQSPREAACAEVEAPSGASETEIAVWRSVCLAGYADLSVLDKEGCAPRSVTPWSVKRRISGGFVSAILQQEPWRSARGGGALHLRCAEIEGELDLSHQALDSALLIEFSRIADPVVLRDAAVGRQVSLRGSVLESVFDAEGARFEADVFLRGATFQAPANLIGARIEGALEAQQARFEAGVRLDQVAVAGPVSLSAVETSGPVGLAGARLAEGADLSDARLFRGLQARDLKSDGALSLNRAEIRGGDADFSMATAARLDLTAIYIQPPRRISLRGARFGVLEAPLEPRSAALDTRALSAERGGWLRASEETLLRWLESGFPAEQSGVSTDFAEESAAYRAFAEALAAAGRVRAAGEILIAERWRALERGQALGFDRRVANLWGWVAGFGHRPERVLLWLAGLIGLGALLGAATPGLRDQGGGRLLALSTENTLFWIGNREGLAPLYHGDPAIAGLFWLQRAAAAALLLAGVWALLT